jgi:hypothetical protein
MLRKEQIMRLLVMLTVVGCALTATAQEFQLRTTTGEVTGPFRFREGETVQIGTNSADIVNVRSHEDRILDAMQAIRIPEVDFRDASIRDVVAFLTPLSVSADPPEIRFVLKLGEPPASGSDDSAVGTTNRAPDSTTDSRPITFSAIDITLKDTLDYVVDIAGYKYRIRDGAVVIMHRNAPDGPIITRMYDVLPSSTTRLRELAAEARPEYQQGDFKNMHSSTHPNTEEEDLKAFFAEMGVDWPTGSEIRFVRRLGKLVVANTEENLAKFEKVLGTFNVKPYQIEIELTFLAVERQRIIEMGPDGVTTASLMALWKSGQADVLAAPRVVTQSGQAATIRGVTEVIYPTTLDVCGSATTNTNDTATAFIVTPNNFLTRETGPNLEVTPEVSPEGSLISICLSPEFVEPPVWEEFKGIFVDADGKTSEASLPQPYFHTYKVTSNVLVTSGKRLLIGGGIPSRDGQRLIYMLLAARLVGTDGEPLR